MKNATAHPIELEQEKMEFLQEMATKYALTDASKAIRCLINYAREHPERQQDIFEEVRCLDC